MAKVVIEEITGGYGSAEALQANFESIASAIENTLSRDGEAPNQMAANLDMNSYRILNLPRALSAGEPLTLGQLEDMSEVVVYEPNPHTHDYTTDISGKPSVFPPDTHVHAITDVSALETSLTDIETDISTLQGLPRAYVQSATPTGQRTNDLWIW